MTGLVDLPFADRGRAGEALAALLAEGQWLDPIVLGLARGGVPVAAPVARGLSAELDVLVVRKIGAPGHEEFGVGAVGPHGPPLFDDESTRALGLSARTLDELADRERAIARTRQNRYRGDRPPPRLADRDVIAVDDGLATGITARLAARELREHRPRRVVLAVPVAARESAAALRPLVDQLVAVAEPRRFLAVGSWYTDFHQVTDQEVTALLGVPDPRSRSDSSDRPANH